MGVDHVALGDTTGMATPAAMKALVGRLRREAPALTLIAHLHDTRGTGLVNALAAYEAGVRHFDCSFGGVGGHPAQVKYGGGYTGNVCTEDLVNLFESLGIRTGIDLAGLIETSRLLRADARPRAAWPGHPQRPQSAAAAAEPTAQVKDRGKFGRIRSGVVTPEQIASDRMLDHVPGKLRRVARWMSRRVALLTDLYQLNMIQAYLDHGETETAVFEFFVRKLPARRGFLMAAGLEQALDFLENLRFSAEEIDWLAQHRPLRQGLARPSCACFASPATSTPCRKARCFFADEPILRVTAPLPQAQLVETRLINILHFQIADRLQGGAHDAGGAGKVLVDFGLRRAHGARGRA